MKKKLLYIVPVIAAAAASAVSCDSLLDLTPPMSEVEDNFYRNETEMYQALTAAYNVLEWSAPKAASGGAQKAGGGKAVIIGFNVSPEPGVLSEARHNGVNVRTFKIIYELLDFVQQEMLNIIPVEHREVIKGHAQVKQIFVLNRVGVAAGSIVLDGVVSSSAKVRVLRNKKVVHTGGIASIRHYKDEVKEVSQAQECGIILSDFEDFHENDIIECFVFEELPKTL